MANKTLGITLEPDKGSIAKMASTIASNVKGVGNMVAGAMGGNIAGALGAGGGMLGQAIGSMAGPAGGAAGGMIGGMIGGVPQMALDALNKMASFVEVFNPAAAHEFYRVFKDITGIVGMLLTPVLQTATKYGRLFADTLLGMSSSLEPAISATVSVFEALLPPLTKFVDLALEANNAFFRLIGLGDLLGNQKRRSSYGLGGSEVNYTGLEEFGKSAHKSFLQMSRAGAATPAQKTANYLEIMQKIMVNWDKIFLDLPNMINNMLPGWAK